MQYIAKTLAYLGGKSTYIAFVFHLHLNILSKIYTYRSEQYALI